MRKSKFNRKKILKRIFFLSGLLILLPVAFLSLSKSNLFSIKNIAVVMDKVSCATSQQIKDFSSLMGQNIFLVDVGKSEKSLKEKFLCIKNINFSKIMPAGIKMDLKGREALAKLILVKWEASTSSVIDEAASPSAKVATGEYLVDEEGVIFSKDSLDITKIYVSDKSLALGMKDNGDLIDSLKILANLKKIGVSPAETIIIDDFLIIQGTPRIIFRLGGNIGTQVASLQLILNKAKIEEQDLEFIDLRFDKPIVKFAPKK